MTLTIALTTTEEARLTAVARQEGIDLVEAARKLLTAGLRPVSEREATVQEPGIHAEADAPDPRTLTT